MGKPLFIIFVTSTISTKLVSLIKNGIINIIIYAHSSLLLQIKKIFSNKMKGEFKIYPLDLPFNFTTFNIFLTSKSFWDNIDQKHENIYILNNPKNLPLTINILNHDKLFYILSFTNDNLHKLIWENPVISDEILAQGFILFIKNKFAKKTLKYFSKNNILTIRKKLNMLNTEHIERQVLIPFYIYFYHYMLSISLD